MNKFEIFEMVTNNLKDATLRDAVKYLQALGVSVGKDTISRYRKVYQETGANPFEDTDTDTDNDTLDEVERINLLELYGITDEEITELQTRVLAEKRESDRTLNDAINKELTLLWAQMFLVVQRGLDNHLQGLQRLPTEHFKMLRELSSLIRNS